MVLMPIARGARRRPVQSIKSIRFSPGPGFSASSGLRMQPPRCPINYEIDGNPECNHEIPVGGILIRVLKTPALHKRREEKYGKHNRVDQIRDQMKHVKS